jgi:hypothetical protein
VGAQGEAGGCPSCLVMLCRAVLCCVVLCCVVLCCAVSCCAVLCCAVLCCAVLCCAVLCCAVLCCAVLCCAGPSAAGDPYAVMPEFMWEHKVRQMGACRCCLGSERRWGGGACGRRGARWAVLPHASWCLEAVLPQGRASPVTLPHVQMCCYQTQL